MTSKEQQRQFLTIFIGGALIAFLAPQVIMMKSDIRELSDALRDQSYQISRLENQVYELTDKDRVVRNSSYYLKQSSKESDEVTYAIEMELDRIFKKPLTLYYKPDTSESWSTVALQQTIGESACMLELSSHNDYEMKIGFIVDGVETYEDLPLLALYSKEDSCWDSDVTTSSVKKNTVEYTIQVAKWRNQNVTELLGVTCEMYYDERLVDSFELVEFMMGNEQKPPRNQLEHEDGEGYWYAKRVVSIPEVTVIDNSRIRYEVGIVNDRQNVFKRTYFVD